jgi:lipid-A-disaccharide synthase
VKARVGIVAAEPSGDLLGAGLMRALHARDPDIHFEGIGGPQMIEAGCESWFPMERLSVMGLVEVLRHLPELLGIRRALRARWRASPPQVYVGVDAPDFNLGLARRLRASGVPTVQYVSPTVWAWRQGRVKALRRATDLVLCVYPFEEDFLRRHGVEARYVGHPLAAEIAHESDTGPARERLGLGGEGPVLAVLPGSRLAEVERLSAPFVDAGRLCVERRPGLRLVSPFVNEATRRRFAAVLRERAPELEWTLADRASRDAMAAADVVLTASGTATLEALLVGRPMVVGYRVHALSYRVVRALRLIKVPHIAMANLLAEEGLAPELVQDDCTAPALADAVLRLLADPSRRAEIGRRYRVIGEGLRRDAGRQAALAVLELLSARRRG